MTPLDASRLLLSAVVCTEDLSIKAHQLLAKHIIKILRTPHKLETETGHLQKRCSLTRPVCVALFQALQPFAG